MSPWRARDAAEGIETALAQRAVPGRGEQEKRYLKSDLDFLGVPVPAIRATVKEFLRAQPELAPDQLLELVATLWASTVYERRSAAVELLTLRQGLLGADDLAFVERLLRDAHTWALVDPLAAIVVGGLVVRFPELAADLDRWAADPDFWIRRSALLALLGPLRAGGGDWERFTRYADALLDEREFFIRKAIGWVLRETAKRRPDLVFDWALPRAARLSGVTYRELVKPLSAAQRTRLDAARAG